MTQEAYTVSRGAAPQIDFTAVAAITGGYVMQLPDGSAGIVPSDIAVGALASAETAGLFKLPKTADIVLLDGGRAFWDRSARSVTFRKVNDRDFYLGRVVGDHAASATQVTVNLNVNPPDDIDVLRDGALSVATGTAAAGGFGLPGVYGNARGLVLTATSEVQCVDILSVDRFAVSANAIVEAIFRVGVNGSTNAVDLNIGVANGTSTSDADAVTEHCYVHIDGGATAINAQSKDGTTTVTAADTTKTFTAGSAVANRKEVWFDMRNPADIQIYVDGVLVLPDSVFRLDNATGPLGLLAHLEKTTGTATAGPVYIDRLAARFTE